MQFENESLRVTVMVEGGHIAELFLKEAKVSPLWIPPWSTMEPSQYDPARHPEYGLNSESKLLAGIMGHNLCLDLFGPPSDEEAAAGLTVHGEASVVAYEFDSLPQGCVARCELPMAQLSFERQMMLEGNRLQVQETVTNRSSYDRPIAWQEHVTLGPPFLRRGFTQFRAPVTRAAVKDSEGEFTWPHASHDLSVFTDAEASSGFTTQLLDRSQPRSYAFAFSPEHETTLGYVWRTEDFPWLGMWEENCGRDIAPWNNRTQTLGLEFGTTPFPETRRAMINRGKFFDTPSYRWLPAKASLSVIYYAALTQSKVIPETLRQFEDML